MADLVSVSYPPVFLIPRSTVDSFLLNKKGLESMSILPKNFCKIYAYCTSQYAYCDRIHIASNTYTYLVEYCVLFSWNSVTLCPLASHLLLKIEVAELEKGCELGEP